MGCGKLDAFEVAFRALVVSGYNCAKVIDLIEESLDETAVSIEEFNGSEEIVAVEHRLDVVPSSLIGMALPEPFAVVGAMASRI